MSTETAPRKPTWRSRLRIRLSVRASITLVLIIGVGLGWFMHRARTQRQAVAAIERAGGTVYYAWQYRYPTGWNTGAPCPWPKWLVDAVGIDCLGTVTVVSMGIGGDQLVGEAEMIQVGRLDRLESLTLNCGRVTDAMLVHLRGLGRIKKLDLYLPNATGAALGSLEGLTSLEDFRFHLGLREDRFADEDIAHLGKLTNLKSLHADFRAPTQVTDAGIAALKTLRNLERLNICNTRITTKGLETIAKLDRLQGLTLSYSPGITSLTPLSSLRRLDNLSIFFSHGLTDDGLVGLSGLTNLTWLNLQSSPIGDAGLAHLRGLTNLTTIFLDKTKVTDAGLKNLSGMANLKLIALSDTAVGDAGVDDLLACRGLENLTLDGTRITDDGLRRLAGLPRCERIYVRRTKVTAAAANAVTLAHPGLLGEDFLGKWWLNPSAP